MRQEISAKRERARAELREVGDLLSLFTSIAWKTFERRLQKRETEMVTDMLAADPANVARLQGRISEIRDILKWPDTFERRLRELEAMVKGQERALERIPTRKR